MTSRKKIYAIIVAVLIVGGAVWAALYFSGAGGTFVNFLITNKEIGTCHLVDGSSIPSERSTCKTNQNWFQWDRANGNILDKRSGRCHESGDPPEFGSILPFGICRGLDWDSWFASIPPVECRVDKGYENLGCR